MSASAERGGARRQWRRGDGLFVRPDRHRPATTPYGILAQSIGGGGGVGADGSVNASTTISLGVGTSGNGGSAGGGNNASVTTALGGTVATTGDDAAAIVAQSIGGGGGVAGAGCGGASVCLLRQERRNPQAYPGRLRATRLNVGGNSGASGNGLNVNVDASDAIRTTGARSMGIVAQSIGGGGGFVTAAAQNLVKHDPWPAIRDATAAGRRRSRSPSNQPAASRRPARAPGVSWRKASAAAAASPAIRRSRCATPASNTLPQDRHAATPSPTRSR